MSETARKQDASDHTDVPVSLFDGDSESRTPAFGDEAPDALAAYVSALHKRPLLTAADEVALGARIARGDREAHRLLVESNLRLVVMLARRYLRKVHHMTFLDLISEGNIGLMHAADKFDAARGFRFSTYAVWWIRQTIERAIMNQERTVRTPVHIRKHTDRLFAATQRLTNKTGRVPTVADLAEHTGIPVAEIPRLQALMYDTTVSGDEPWDEDGRHTFLESLVDHNLLDHTDIVARQEATNRLHQSMAKLTARQRRVLALRYGIPDGDTHTLESVATILGVTCERVRQIQVQATRQLHAILARAMA